MVKHQSGDSDIEDGNPDPHTPLFRYIEKRGAYIIGMKDVRRLNTSRLNEHGDAVAEGKPWHNPR